MKDITKKILELLVEKDNSKEQIEELLIKHPSFKYQDIPLTEIPQKYDNIHNDLLDFIESGDLDEISYGRRNGIYTHLTNLYQGINNPTSVITHIDALNDTLRLANLNANPKTPEDYKKEFVSIKQNREEYSKFLREIGKTKETVKQVENLSFSVKQIHEELDIRKENVDAIFEEIQQVQSETVNKETSIEDILTDIKAVEKEIEAKKLNIDTFNSNIEEYKSSIENLKEKAKQIVSNETKITSLIDEAKSALQLSSTVGVSAAFSTMYDKANDKNILIGWISGALGLICVAIFITVWIAAGWGIDENNVITSTVGRVVAVGIAITGATFCSKQYIRQKNIIDDYAYKATLSKSIIAFTDKIKESNEQQVAEYLTKVLDEIHKDPLRKRGEEKDDGAINMEVIEKFTRAVSNLYPKTK